MQVSQAGIDLIKHFEGLRLEAYQDVAGIWTIGYGHTGPDVKEGMTITEAEAESLLRRDLGGFERGVSNAVTMPLGTNQFDALVSLTYNIGVNAFRGSTARRFLNKGDYLGCAEAMTWWNKATINGRKQEVPGLVRRRAAEAALFLTDLPEQSTPEPEGTDESRLTPEENSPRRGNILGSRTVEGAVVAGAGGAAGAGSAMMGGEDRSTEAPATTQNAPQTGAQSEGPPATSGADTTTGTQTEVPPPSDSLSNTDYQEAFQIAAGVIVVLAVIYILLARIDDWVNYRR